MLSKDMELPVISGRTIKIKGTAVSENGREIYDAELSGDKGEYALIWYEQYPSDAAYDSIKGLCGTDCPCDSFMWPVDVTELYEDTYGYVIRRPDSSMLSLGDILCGRKAFASDKARTEFCIELITAFTKLHEMKLCCADFSADMIFADRETGKTAVFCCDRIVSEGDDACRYKRSPRFTAPELLEEGTAPTMQSDTFSLAVLTFMLMYGGHPFEGEASLVSCMTPEREKKIYGSSAVFIFDEEDRSNKPVRLLNRGISERWNSSPDFMKEIIREMFSHKAITEPAERYDIKFMLDAFVQYRTELSKRTAAGEKKLLEAEYLLRVSNGRILLYAGTKIGISQLDSTAKSDETVLEVVSNPKNQNELGLKNCTAAEITAIKNSGEEKIVAPGKTAPLSKIAGIRLNGKYYVITGRDDQ